MNPRPIVPLLILAASAVLPVSCGPPREIPYEKLQYRDGLFVDPQSSGGFSGVARDRHSNGNPKAEFPIRNGKFHGVVREWHPNGKLRAETEFRDGERVGRNREWTENGLPYIERVYDRDRIVSEKKFDVGR